MAVPCVSVAGWVYCSSENVPPSQNLVHLKWGAHSVMGQHREGYDCLRVCRTWLYDLKRYGWHLLFSQGLEELKHLAFFAESLPAELWTLLDDFSNYIPHAVLFHVMKVPFTSVYSWKSVVTWLTLNFSESWAPGSPICRGTDTHVWRHFLSNDWKVRFLLPSYYVNHLKQCFTNGISQLPGSHSLGKVCASFNKLPIS